MVDAASAYQAASESALMRWKNCPGIGFIQPPPFHPAWLAITTGAYLKNHQAVFELRADLENVVGDDPLADIVPRQCLHFTFLALSPHEYETEARIPPLHHSLRESFREHCRGRRFSVSNLRLVALPNALLLAGIPGSETLKQRERFAKALLSSSWREHLVARYPNGSIPPLFWHMTLLRYHADCVSRKVREFFLARRDAEYGEICLPIRLVAANYNWKHFSDLVGEGAW